MQRSWKFIHIVSFCAYHDKSCGAHVSKQRTVKPNCSHEPEWKTWTKGRRVFSQIRFYNAFHSICFCDNFLKQTSSYGFLSTVVLQLFWTHCLDICSRTRLLNTSLRNVRIIFSIVFETRLCWTQSSQSWKVYIDGERNYSTRPTKTKTTPNSNTKPNTKRTMFWTPRHWTCNSSI